MLSFDDDYVYNHYCDAAEELNNNWENYSNDSQYPDIWGYYADELTKYYICIDNIPDFIFNDNIEILYDFSQCCKKIEKDND